MARILLVLTCICTCRTSSSVGSDLESAKFLKYEEEMKSFIDDAVDPCDDFYEYACGNWKRLHEIPDDRVELGVLQIINDRLKLRLKDLLEDHDDGADSMNQAAYKTKQFFASCMNEEALQNKGMQSVMSALKSIGKWPLLNDDWSEDDLDLTDLVAQMHLKGVDLFFGTEVYQDLSDSDRQILYIKQVDVAIATLLSQSTLTPRAVTRKSEVYIVRIFELIGIPSEVAQATAKEVFNLHRQIEGLKVSNSELILNWTQLAQRMPFSVFEKRTRAIDFHRYLEIVSNQRWNVSEPVIVLPFRFLIRVDLLLRIKDPRILVNYIMFKYLQSFVVDGPEVFVEATNAMEAAYFGAIEMNPRWERCLDTIMTHLNDPLSSMYIKRYFDEESRIDVQSMVSEIQSIFKQNVNSSSWLDIKTKKAILEKMDNMEAVVGYPEYLLDDQEINQDYENLTLTTDDYIKNKITVLHQTIRKAFKRLHRPVRRFKSVINPIVMNAGYEFPKNRILITAAILQPPLYSRHFPRPMNLAAIGSFIGHEVMHGFDSIGQRFHHDGSVRNLWTEATTERYNQEIAKCFRDKYAEYDINEVLTENENVADTGGLEASFEALNRWLLTSQHSESSWSITWTPKQLFFLNYAQLWCHKSRPNVTTYFPNFDRHSPPKYRVNVPLSNFDEFSKEFNCTSSAHMNSEKKCKIW